MSDQTLYLFKTTRRPLYRRENLNLLAAERGTVHEYAWNRSWVSPEFFVSGSIARGARVYFVFAERPYARFVPVRDGQVVSADWDETLLRLRVLLNNPVAVEDVELDTFTHVVKQAGGGNAPPSKFVVPKLHGMDLRVLYDDDEVPGWRRSVDEILAMSEGSESDAYAGTVFFRPGGVRVAGGERLPSRRAVLHAGDEATLRLHFHNPHLDEASLADLSLRVDAPPDSVELGTVPQLPLNGTVDVPFTTLDGAEPELRIEIEPRPARHTWVLQRLVRAGHEQRVRVATEPTPEGPDRDALLRTYRLVMWKGTFDPDDEADVLEAFGRLLPDEQEIQEKRALVLLDAGREPEAFAILSELNREVLGDRARRFLFRQRLVREPEAEPYRLVEAYELAAEGRFSQLVEEMDGLPDATLNRLVPSLLEHLPEPAQRTSVLDRFGRRLTDPAAAVETARNFYLGSSDEGAAVAFEYLNEMRRVLGTNHRAILEALVELANAGGENRFDQDLRRVMQASITNLIERDEIAKARGSLRQVSASLSGSERRHLYHEIADRLDRRQRLEEAAEVMVEFAWECCRHGNLEDGSEAVTRARGLWAAAGHEAASPEIVQAGDAVRTAWEDTQELVEWRKSSVERRRERLRAKLLNRHLLLAGGHKDPEWIDWLHDLTGAEVDWCEAFRDETDGLASYAERIRNGQYVAVIHYLQKTGHGTGEVLKPACEAAGVAWLDMTSAGRRGVEEALEGWGRRSGQMKTLSAIAFDRPRHQENAPQPGTARSEMREKLRELDLPPHRAKMISDSTDVVLRWTSRSYAWQFAHFLS